MEYNSSYSRLAIHMLRQRWASTDADLAEIGVDVDQIFTSAVCPLESHVAVFALLCSESRLGNSASYLFARRLRLSYMGPSAAMMLSAPTIKEALTRGVQITNATVPHLNNALYDLGGNTIEVVWRAMPDNVFYEDGYMKELQMLSTAKITAEILAVAAGGISTHTCTFYFPVKRPPASDLVASILNGINVVWDDTEPTMRLCVTRDFAEQPLMNSSPDVYAQSMIYAETYFASLQKKDINTRLALDAIRSMPPSQVSLRSVARSLNVSESVLKDRLRTEGTTFTSLRNEAHIEVAIRLARQGASRAKAADHFNKSSANFGEWFKSHHPEGKTYTEVKV